MPTSDTLVGLGIQPSVAERLGGNYSTVAGVGTTQTGGPPPVLKTKNVEITTTGGNTAVILPSTAEVNDEFSAFVSTATTAVIFVPVGHTLNGSLNGSFSIAQNKSGGAWQYKPKFWASWVSA